MTSTRLFHDKVLDVLVHVCQASDSDLERAQWSNFWLDTEGTEYRFVGSLGFGGKFRRDPHQWSVDCYVEDMTPERRAKIAVANGELEALRREWEEDAVGPLEGRA